MSIANQDRIILGNHDDIRFIPLVLPAKTTQVLPLLARWVQSDKFLSHLCTATRKAMSITVGRGCFPAQISEMVVCRLVMDDDFPCLTLWQKIKDFFFFTHQGEAMEYLYKLCHPKPSMTKQDVLTHFIKLKELAYSGYEDYFLNLGNEEILDLRIMGDTGNILLTVYFNQEYAVEWKEAIQFIYPMCQP